MRQRYHLPGPDCEAGCGHPYGHCMGQQAVQRYRSSTTSVTQRWPTWSGMSAVKPGGSGIHCRSAAARSSDAMALAARALLLVCLASLAAVRHAAAAAVSDSGWGDDSDEDDDFWKDKPPPANAKPEASPYPLHTRRRPHSVQLQNDNGAALGPCFAYCRGSMREPVRDL